MHDGGGYQDEWEEKVGFIEVNLSKEARAKTRKPCGCYHRVLILSFRQRKSHQPYAGKEMIKCEKYEKLILIAIKRMARKPEMARPPK